MAKKSFDKLASLLLWPAALVMFAFFAWAVFNFAQSREYKNLILHPGGGVKLSSFNLIDTRNQRFTEEQFLGKWSIVFFGYTTCPHICPTTLAELKGVLSQLADKGVDDVRVVFIAVDSLTEELGKLDEYVKYFDSRIVATTGSHEHLLQVANFFNTHFYVLDKDEITGPGVDTIQHSSSLFIVSPEAEYAALITPPLNAAEITADMLLLKRRSSNTGKLAVLSPQ